jgi:hypothetical protein
LKAVEMNEQRKKVGGIALPAGCFAYAPNGQAWRLPIVHPHKNRALNLVLCAVKRFGEVPIPEAQRPAAWRKILAQAQHYNVAVPDRMPPLTVKAPKTVHAQARQQQQKLLAESLAQKLAHAEAALRCERFLKSLGYESDEREDQ